MNINKGDNLFLHTNSAGLLQYVNNNKVFDIFYDALIRRIGVNGSIVLPAYNYNFTKKKYFDYLKSKSEVGILSNYFLKKYPKKRTVNPIFSHILIGKKLSPLLKKIDYDLLGKNSIFSFFEKKNFKIICFCCQPSQITFLHYLEKKNNVPYRFNKIFKGKIKLKKEYLDSKIRYYVGKKKIDYSLKSTNLLKFLDGKNFIDTTFGRFLCYIVRAKYLAKVLKKELKTNPHFLINEN